MTIKCILFDADGVNPEEIFLFEDLEENITAAIKKKKIHAIQDTNVERFTKVIS